MDWFAPIDIYCERISPGLLAEPLNALTNFAFIACGGWFLTLATRRKAEWTVRLLAAMVIVIGLGSLAFHTFADRWSALADVLPITVFIYGYLAFALRRFAGASWGATVSGLGLLLLATILVERLSPAGFLNGSAGYVPAWLAGAMVAAWLARKGHPASAPLLIASALLAVSLAFRTVDQAVCERLTIGTHFLWHLLNAGLLGAYLHAALEYGSRK